MAEGDKKESKPQDGGKDPDERKDGKGWSARKWLKEIALAEKDLADWKDRGKAIYSLYSRQKPGLSVDRKFAILWANTEVLKTTVYARSPVPVVSRRFSDRDLLGREVAEVLERTLSSVFDRANIDGCLRKVRDDFLLVGRGTAWVRYVPDIEDEDFGDGDPTENLVGEGLAFDFVHFTDFVHPQARAWDDLPWVGRRVYLSKDGFKDRFGEELYDKVKFEQDKDSKGSSYEDGSEKKSETNKLRVYEIWSRTEKKVMWLARDYEEFLDEEDPLYKLHGFWPCPKPAFGTLASDSLTPIPDYLMYQDQAEEIDDLTKRIGLLSDSLKLVGFYPAGAEGDISGAIERALDPSTQNMMIPVPAWSAFMKGGGTAGQIQWLPVEAVAKTLQACIELRKQLIDDVYQITGISDILRGETEAQETATAQGIKAQWGGVRIRDRQSEIARFSRDLCRIAAEIIAEKFQADTLWKVSGTSYPTNQQKQQVQMAIAAIKQYQQQAQASQQHGVQLPPPQVQPPTPDDIKFVERPSQEDILGIIRNELLLQYKVDIEVDSTIEANEEKEKQARNEFLTAVGGFFKNAVPLARGVPQLVPAFGEMLMFLVRGYRTGRSLEDAIQRAVDELEDAAKQMIANPKPDPKVANEQAKIQADMQKHKDNLGLEQQKHKDEMAMKDKELNLKHAPKPEAPPPLVDNFGNELKKRELDHKVDMDHRNHQLEIAKHNEQLVSQNFNEPMQEASSSGADDLKKLLQSIQLLIISQHESTAAIAEVKAAQVQVEAKQAEMLGELVKQASKPKTVTMTDSRGQQRTAVVH